MVISDKYVNKHVKRLACFLFAPGWAKQKEVCKRELKDPFKGSKSAPPLIYHTAATTTPRICLAHVLRMT